VALNVDPPAEREPARALLDELAWPFGRGFTSEEALQVLELVQAALHDDARSLALPAGFLVDPSGRLIATYVGLLDPERVHADLALLDLSPSERRDASVPFPGRWIAPLPDPLDDTVAARLVAHGLERPAAEYSLARIEVRAAGAKLSFEAGLARQREGRLADAAGAFRKALEADPGYVAAAQALALVLHQQGDVPAALAAYQVALALEPGHAPTRRNLGYLHVERGDMESARRELTALESLESELASALAEKIRQAEGQ
jgi:tetratricopeptide (TPR) repeat protein